jgi:hypothetical protein
VAGVLDALDKDDGDCEGAGDSVDVDEGEDEVIDGT